ncbi:MAG TPA: four helix bundle protein, partial [Gemmatimonadaceae bacterium]|nr:four helix bundle protein [Gemmatimonadaceae bacterium]
MGRPHAHPTIRGMNLDEWVETAPSPLRESPLWKVRVYQIGTYVARLAGQDATALERHPRFAETVSQLVKSAGSVPATVSEGYSRQSRRERIKYYEYALGCAREASTWYSNAADTLPPEMVEDRLTLLARACQLLLKMIQNERKGKGRDFPRELP